MKDTIFRLACWFPSRPINVSIRDVSWTKRGHHSLVDTDSIRSVLTAMMPTLRRRTNEADDVDQQSFAPEKENLPLDEQRIFQTEERFGP